MTILDGQIVIKKTRHGTRVRWESGLTGYIRGNDICAGPGTLRSELCQDLEDSIQEGTIKCKAIKLEQAGIQSQSSRKEMAQRGGGGTQ